MIFIGDFSIGGGGTPVTLSQLLSFNGYSYDRTVVNGSSIVDLDAFVASGEERTTINDILVIDETYYIASRTAAFNASSRSGVLTAVSSDGTILWERRFDAISGHTLEPLKIVDLGSSLEVTVVHDYPVLPSGFTFSYWYYQVNKTTGDIIGTPQPWQEFPRKVIDLPNGGSLFISTFSFYFFDSNGDFVNGFTNNDVDNNIFIDINEVKVIGDRIYTWGWYYDYINYDSTSTYGFSAAHVYDFSGNLIWGSASTDEFDDGIDANNFLMGVTGHITDAGDIFIVESYDRSERNITLDGVLYTNFVDLPYVVVKRINNQGQIVWKKKFSNDTIPSFYSRPFTIATLTVDDSHIAFTVGSTVVICDLAGNMVAEKYIDVMRSNNLSSGEDPNISQLLLSGNTLHTVWSNDGWMQTDARDDGAHVLSSPKILESFMDAGGHVLVWDRSEDFRVTATTHTSLYQISTVDVFEPVSSTYTWTSPVSAPALQASTRMAISTDVDTGIRANTAAVTADHFFLNYSLTGNNLALNDYAAGISFDGSCSDSLGNFYVYGTQGYFDINSVVEDQHSFVMKVSSSGSVLWSKKIQRDIVLNEQYNDMFVKDDILFVLSRHNASGNILSQRGGEIVRLNASNGAFIDTRSYLGIQFGRSLVPTASSNTVAVAYDGPFFQSQPNDPADNGWLSVIDCSANTVSVNVRFDASGFNNCFAERVVSTTDGYRGLFRLRIISPASSSYSVVRLNSSGAIVWQKQLSIAKSGRALRTNGNHPISVDSENNTYVHFTVARTDGVPTADYTDPEIVVVKLDSDGNIVWSKSYITSLPKIDNYRCRANGITFNDGKMFLSLFGGRRMQAFNGVAPAFLAINLDGTFNKSGSLIAHAGESFTLTSQPLVPTANSIGFVFTKYDEAGGGYILNVPYGELNPQIELLPHPQFFPKGHYYYNLDVAIADYTVTTSNSTITSTAVTPVALGLGTFNGTANLHPNFIATINSVQ